jgi:hypothetical protein
MNLLSTLSQIENNDDLHLGRLLVLLGEFAGDHGAGTVDGLTKLAKLDFLLRYPVYLERALKIRGAATTKLQLEDFERKSIESTMVRFRFGPWDFRYRRFLNLLIAKGLVRMTIEGRTVSLGLTDEGVAKSKELSTQDRFTKTAERAHLLKQNLDLSATNLMRFIYDTFPEISSMAFGEEITL